MIRANTIIDLTKSLDKSFIPYSKGKYVDPPLELTSWSSIERNGFRVERLSLGTQSGTHIDAPAHFCENGETLESLSPQWLVGKYFLLDWPCQVEDALTSYQNESIVFLRIPGNHVAEMSGNDVKRIVLLPLKILVVSGGVIIAGDHPYAFHRLVAKEGKFLVEELDEDQVHHIPKDGEMFIAPLNLSGVSGSPCRVMIRSHFKLFPARQR